MAYRKRVKLSNGLYLNFSGSGVGIGCRLFPGLSISTNSNGLYYNTSIPGTGFYSRNKICGWENTAPVSNNTKQSNKTEVEFKFSGKFNEDGQFYVEIRFNETGELIDERILSKIKRQAAYKETIQKLYQNAIQELKDETEKFTDIYKLTAKTINETDLKKSLENLKPEVFIPHCFEEIEKKPTREDIKLQLQKKAEREMFSLLFWTNKAKRKAFVDENLEPQYNSAYSKWLSAKEKFEQQENSRKEKELQRIKSEYDNQKLTLESMILGSDKYVSSQIDHVLSSLEMPFNFEVSYEYEEKDGLLLIQLDLPEIASLPKRKASILASRKLSVKNKTIFEQNSEYATCVTGLAFFFAGMFFNISTHIKWIQINGFTQKIDEATGHRNDVYIYSVLFNRCKFSTINYERMNPIKAIASFPCKMNYLKNAEMKEIDVFQNSEIKRLIST